MDFGLSTIKAEFEGTSYYSSTVGGALRWRAPELLAVSEHDVAPNLSTACDIYSYGSIMLQVRTTLNLMLVFDPHIYHQVLSGRVPYHYFSENRVLHAVSNGIRPRRPSEPWVNEVYWKFIQRCWGPVLSARPCIEEVNDHVTAFHRRCMDVTPVQQERVPIHFQGINRHLRPFMPSMDGYESDYESLHVLSTKTKSSGCLSEQEGSISRRKPANKSRIIRSRYVNLSWSLTWH